MACCGIRHRVPEWSGTDLARTFEFENGTSREIGNAGGLVQPFLWQRV